MNAIDTFFAAFDLKYVIRHCKKNSCYAFIYLGFTVLKQF